MKAKLTINNREYDYYPLEGVESLPYSLRILYENALLNGYSSTLKLCDSVRLAVRSPFTRRES
ncbi:MAG: hypothetical protein GX842_08970 [Spirochaetales bacterium]|nr:hypothetical protein [Spirochaetales bacterium]